MALTQNTNYLAGNVSLPTGYTNPTLPDLPAGTVEKSGFTTTIAAASVDNADPVVGAGNLITEVESHITTSFVPDVLGLDVTKTINMNSQIIKAIRGNSGALFETGTEEYTVTVHVEYIVTP